MCLGPALTGVLWCDLLMNSENRRSNPLAALSLMVFRTMLGLGYPQLLHGGAHMGPHGTMWAPCALPVLA